MAALHSVGDYHQLKSRGVSRPQLEMAGLAASANVRRFKPGETIFMEGDAAPYCYQVVSGVVKEYNTLEDGRRQVADFYGIGELFGISEMDEQLHTAEAITDCAVRCYPRDHLLHAVAISPELSHQFLDTLMTRLHHARERMIMLGRMSAMQRVASFLIKLSSQQCTDQNIRLAMSRQDIADHLGLTIETVCRVLTELRKKGVIIMPSARLYSIPDGVALEDIAHGSVPAH